MISDDELYRLAIFLGSAAMLLIILYHFLEINAVEEPATDSKTNAATPLDTKLGSIGRWAKGNSLRKERSGWKSGYGYQGAAGWLEVQFFF
jgi:oligosaccharyl transferase complex subunit OST4